MNDPTMERRINIINLFRKTHLLFLCWLFGILFITGCYNNAHLRTQRILEQGEKVYSGSGIIALGESDDYSELRYTGIAGFRGEFSFLTRKGDVELGPYIGFGIGEAATSDYIIGFDYKRYKYINKTVPWKLGFQAELNVNPKSGFEEGFQGGTVFQIRPSLISTTAIGRPLYGGIHGLFGYGKLKSNPYWEDKTKGFSYTLSGIGVGLTAGTERLSSISSIQFQLDLTLIRNTTYSVEYPPDIGADYYLLEDYEPSSRTFFMITGSAGMNLFNPPPKPKVLSEPYPLPYLQEKEISPESKLQYDPETGLPVREKPKIQFNPETGEPIKPQQPESDKKELQFDPETGKSILPGKQFDPETGELITPPSEEPKPEKVYLSGKVVDIVLTGGIKIQQVKMISIEGDILNITYLEKQINADILQDRKQVNMAIEISRITAIVAGEKQGFVGGVLGCVGGCAISYCTLFFLAMMAESEELFMLAMISVPIGAIVGANRGYNKQVKETHDLSRMSPEQKRNLIISIVWKNF